jgi:glutaredoxin
MKRIMLVGVVVTVALFGVAPSFAQTIYKSIGPNGTTVYSDHPPKDGKITKTITFADLPSSSLPATAPTEAAASVTAAAERSTPYASTGTILYTTQWCGYCKRARAYLAQKRIAYRDIDVETPSGRSAFAQAGGGHGVPLLIAGSRRIRGFSANGYDAFFAAR